jgi:hypothetical protein
VLSIKAGLIDGARRERYIQSFRAACACTVSLGRPVPGGLFRPVVVPACAAVVRRRQRVAGAGSCGLVLLCFEAVQVG